MPTLSNHDPFRASTSTYVDAPIDHVYDALTDVASLRALIDPNRITMEVRPEGPFFLETWRDGRARAHYGRWLVLQKPALVELTWVDESTSGGESIVTFDLATRGPGTAVTVTHSGLADEENTRIYEVLWKNVLDRLPQQFRKAA
jgi:uncharacterized protein YndB with AHSA1/START domain